MVSAYSELVFSRKDTTSCLASATCLSYSKLSVLIRMAASSAACSNSFGDGLASRTCSPKLTPHTVSSHHVDLVSDRCPVRGTPAKNIESCPSPSAGFQPQV